MTIEQKFGMAFDLNFLLCWRDSHTFVDGQMLLGLVCLQTRVDWRLTKLSIESRCMQGV